MEEALAVLKNVRIVRQRFGELDQSIQLLSTGVFASGTPESVKTFVTGVLTERVVAQGTADFAVDEFLQAVGTTALEHGLSGLLRELMAYSAASGLRPRPQHVSFAAAAVTWAHEWLREYSLIETLVARLQSVSAVSLAKTIHDSCETDHVARAAAAAGLKWIVANPAVGSPQDYRAALAMHRPGLAREALIVLLEGSPTPGILRIAPGAGQRQNVKSSPSNPFRFNAIRCFGHIDRGM